jgi:hypothetical protein
MNNKYFIFVYDPKCNVRQYRADNIRALKSWLHSHYTFDDILRVEALIEIEHNKNVHTILVKKKGKSNFSCIRFGMDKKDG